MKGINTSVVTVGGYSQAIILPKKWLRQNNLHVNDKVTLISKDNSILILLDNRGDFSEEPRRRKIEEDEMAEPSELDRDTQIEETKTKEITDSLKKVRCARCLEENLKGLMKTSPNGNYYCIKCSHELEENKV